MRKVKLVIDKPFPSYAEIYIIDVTSGKEVRRAGLTAEYSEYDVKPLVKKGMTIDEAVKDYDEWLQKTLKRFLLDECEIVSGHSEFLQTIRNNIEKYFD